MTIGRLLLFIIALALISGGVAIFFRLLLKSLRFDRKAEEEQIAHLLTGGAVVLHGDHEMTVRLSKRSEQYAFNLSHHAKNKLRNAKRSFGGNYTVELIK